VGYRKASDEGEFAVRIQRIRRVLGGVLVLNLAVASAKLFWGFVTGSISMQADGFHSLFDGASNVVGLIGLSLASRPADSDHPYGHGKYESYASAAIGVMLGIVAYNVASTAVGRLLEGSPPPRVDGISFAVMLGTMAINIAVTLYERRAGKRLGSELLVADASHTASDVVVSSGVIGGLIAVRLGYPAADPIIALLVAMAIAYAAFDVLRHAGVTLSDTARIDSAEVYSLVTSVPGVLGCHHVRTRGSQSEVHVDLHVQVESTATVTEGHALAECVERAVCEHFDQVVDVVTHLEPLDAYQMDKTDQEQDARSP